MAKGSEPVLILLRCSVEEADGIDVAVAFMRLSQEAASEYHLAIQAIRSVAFSGKSLNERALDGFCLTAVQRHHSSVPWACYLPDDAATPNPDFWTAVDQLREADDYCALAIPVSACPRDEEIVGIAEAIPLEDDLVMRIHPLGIEWTGRCTEPDSDVTIGDLPRRLVEDLAAGQVQFATEYWEGE